MGDYEEEGRNSNELNSLFGIFRSAPVITAVVTSEWRNANRLPL